MHKKKFLKTICLSVVVLTSECWAKEPKVCSEGVTSNNYQERVSLLTKCIENLNSTPANRRYWYFFKRGYGNEQLENIDLALIDYIKATELNPKHADSYYNSGNIFYKTGKPDKAHEYYTKALELGSKNYGIYYGLGQIYKDRGEFQKAIREYTKTIAVKKDYAAAYLNRGHCKKKLGQYKEAWENYNKAIEADPNYELAYNDRAYLYYQFGKYDLALADYNKAIEIKPDYTNALANRASLYRKIGKNDLALNDYNKTVSVEPDNGMLYYFRGYFHQKVGNDDAAVQDFEKSISIKPDYAWSYNNLAKIYINREEPRYKKPEKAVGLLLKANEVSSGKLSLVNHNLASAYAELGQFKEAVRYQSIALSIANKNGSKKRVEQYQNRLEKYKNNMVSE